NQVLSVDARLLSPVRGKKRHGQLVRLYDRPLVKGGRPLFFFLSDSALALADLSARAKSRAQQSSAWRRRRKGGGANGEPARAPVGQGWRVSATGGLSLTDRKHDGTLVRKRRGERSRGGVHFALWFFLSVLKGRSSAGLASRSMARAIIASTYIRQLRSG